MNTMLVLHLKKHWMSVAWTAFLSAAMMEMLVFALVDPSELHWLGQHITWSREAIYTLAFFVFWAIAIVFNSLTLVLAMTSEEINT
jgi:hypothetical protein